MTGSPPASDRPLRTPVAERLLVDSLSRITGPRVLTTTLGRAQLAAAIASAHPDARVVCHVFDVYHAGRTRQALEKSNARVDVHCGADLPGEEVDTVAIPVDMQGEAELTREVLQAGHQALRLGGRMHCATNNPRDRWLGGELGRLFAGVRREEFADGAVYVAEKDAPLKKLKRFECEFAFRDQGRLITAISRPGVFSHRSLDAGARALINTMTVRENDRVVDLGCGSGTVGFAAALRARNVQVLSIDSHTRAIECTERGARRNGLSTLRTRLTADGDTDTPGEFDVVLANPPYYSGYRISEVFLQSALSALRPGGHLYLVTKLPDWYAARMPQLFEKLVMHPHKAYMVLEARKPTPRRGPA